MSRRKKNIGMVLFLIVFIGLIFFTMNMAKGSMYNQNMIPNMNQNGEVPPQMPQNDFDNQGSPNGKFQESDKDSVEMNRFEDDRMNKSQGMSMIYYGLLIVENIGLSLIVLYLIMSHFNKKSMKETFVNGDKILICVLATVVLTMGLTVGESYGVQKIMSLSNHTQTNKKETTTDNIDEGKIVNDSQIDLSQYSSNITITKAGEYTLTGSFKYAVLINAEGTVTLHLDNVTIENDITAAIANISENELIIDLVDDSENVLQDGGSSEYDACLFSMGALTIEGNGSLKVNGCQEEGEGIATEAKNMTIQSGSIDIEANDDGLNAGGDGGLITINGGNIFIKASGDGIDSNQNLIINGGTIYTMGSSLGGDAGIDTDEGFQINGGTVIALGSDMLETPLDDSKQQSMCFNLDSQISKNTLVTLMSSDDEVIVSFVAEEDFKTLIISSDYLKEGEYSLYTGGSHSGEVTNSLYSKGVYTKGEKITVNNSDTFTLLKTVNLFGKNVK